MKPGIFRQGTKFYRKQEVYPVRDENGKWIWKNLFRIDLWSIFFIAILLLIAWGYKHDIAQCEEVIVDPCGFCEKSNCCENILYNSENGTLFSLDIDKSLPG